MGAYYFDKPDDSRKHHRIFARSLFPKDTVVSFRSQGTNSLEKGVLHSISPAGLFIKCERPIPIGTDLGLIFSFGENHVHCNGRIIYQTRENNDLTTPGFGVVFTHIQTEDHRAIVKSIDEFFGSLAR